MTDGHGESEARADARILWFTRDRSAWFLLPKDVELPEGSFLIRDLKGVRRRTSPEALEPYAVSEAEARRVVGERLGHAWEGLRGTLGQLFGEKNPLPEELESVLGVDPGRVGTDPKAAREVASKLGGALQGWFAHLGDDLDKVADDAGDAVKRARTRYEHDPADTLKADIGKVIGDIGERLRDMGERLSERSVQSDDAEEHEGVEPAAPEDAVGEE